MELTQLYYFYLTAKYEHISRTSKEINIAQPALTKQIHNLEDELGVSLFKRVGRNIKLTEWGVWLKNNIEEPLNKLHNIKEEIEHLKLSNHIKICAKVASNFITNIMLNFKEQHNDITFSLTLSGEDDCDILVKTAKEGFKEEICLASGNFFWNKIKDITDLESAPFITFTVNKELRKTIDDYFNIKNIKANIAFECENINSIHDLIKRDNGIGFIPEFTSGVLKNDLKLFTDSNFIITRYIEVKKNPYGICNEKLLEEFYDYMCDCFKNKRVI